MPRLGFGFVLALLLSFPIGSHPRRIDDVQSAVRPLWAEQLLSPGLYARCTAFAIHRSRALWMTAAHCLGVNLWIAADDRTPSTLAQTVWVDERADLAVLKGPTPRLALRYAARVEPRQSIWVVGYPVGLDQRQIFHGFVSSLNTLVGDPPTWVMTFDLESCRGLSGSPVLSAQGRVVSVLQGGWGDTCSGFTYGVRWTDLVRLTHTYFEG